MHLTAIPNFHTGVLTIKGHYKPKTHLHEPGLSLTQVRYHQEGKKPRYLGGLKASARRRFGVMFLPAARARWPQSLTM